MMQVTRTTTHSLDDILKRTPRGKIAMFRVTSMSANAQADDWILGENVYVHNGRVWDFIRDIEQGPVEEFGLHFVSYIDR